MKQLALDIGLSRAPSLSGFFAGGNTAALAHLRECVTDGAQGSHLLSVPTYLWGPQGCGKSHLLKAIREILLEQGVSVGWRDASNRNALSFDERWGAVILDDVHLYNNAQQAVAFNWFINAMNPPSGPVRWVLAAGGLPAADLTLREDLRSRLGWGHVFQIKALDDAQRCQVLRKEAAARGLLIGDEVLDYILTRFSRDLGHLMEVLDRLDHHALRARRAITLPLLKDMLDSL